MDVIQILNHFSVTYVDSHSSLSSKCVGVDCPVCGDKKKHLGIFRDKGNVHCWKCGYNGSLYNYLKESQNVYWKDFQEITGIGKHKGDTALENIKNILEKEKRTKNIQTTPKLDSARVRMEKPNLTSPTVKRFLKERRFSPSIFEFYGALFCRSGKWINRLAIPLHANFKGSSPLGYAARALSPRISPRWLFTKEFPVHDHLYFNNPYNDDWKRVTIVEGIFDAWALPDMAVCIFGTELSFVQLIKLSLRFTSDIKMRIILDGDAHVKARKIRDKLSPFFSSIEVIYLEENQDVSSCWANEERGELFDVL